MYDACNPIFVLSTRLLSKELRVSLDEAHILRQRTRRSTRDSVERLVALTFNHKPYLPSCRLTSVLVALR